MNSAVGQQLVSGQAVDQDDRLPLFSLAPIKLVRYWSRKQ